MGESTENVFDKQDCTVCGADTALLSADPLAQQLAAHLTDYSDPHRTLRLVPQVHYGVAAPALGDGYNPGDWYIDTKNCQTYSYRKVQEDPDKFEWTPATPSVSASLANYVYVTPSGTPGAQQERDLDKILASYLTVDAADSSYASRQQVDILRDNLAWFLSIDHNRIVLRGDGSSDSTSFDDWARSVSSLQECVLDLDSKKQDMLEAGENIVIDSETNVISAIPPVIECATTVADGLMSSSHVKAINELATELRHMQPRLTNDDNAGDYVVVDDDGRIHVFIPDVTEGQSGLMTAADKAKLAGLPTTVPQAYVLPVAAPEALGGVRISGITKVVDTMPGGQTYLDPVGWTPCRLGQYNDYIYSKDAPVATLDTFGTVKVGGSLATGDTGYVPCMVDADGRVCYSTAVQTVATGNVLGGVKVDANTLNDTTGYEKLKVSADGTAYYGRSTVTDPPLVTSTSPGTIRADSTAVSIDNIGQSIVLSTDNWMKVRCDDDGYAYFNHGIASGSSLGHVRVSETVLTNTAGFSLCQVDRMGRIYYAPGSTEKATSTILGGVMVDTSVVDPASPDPYVKCRVDSSGYIYSKGYADEIAELKTKHDDDINKLKQQYDAEISTLKHMGVGHDILVTAHVDADGMCTLTNNAMNYVPVTGTSDVVISLRFPARLNPATNARDFFVVLSFPSTWSASQKLTLTNGGSFTQGETIVVLGDPDNGLVFLGRFADCTTVLYFTEVTFGTFVVSRKTVTRIME